MEGEGKKLVKMERKSPISEHTLNLAVSERFCFFCSLCLDRAGPRGAPCTHACVSIFSDVVACTVTCKLT